MELHEHDFHVTKHHHHIALISGCAQFSREFHAVQVSVNQTLLLSAIDIQSHKFNQINIKLSILLAPPQRIQYYQPITQLEGYLGIRVNGAVHMTVIKPQVRGAL